jgi:hypothetical protein
MKSLSHCIFLRKDKKIQLDEKTVFFAVEKCIQEQYGKQGGVNIRVVSWKKKTLTLCIEKAIWRTEFLHQKEMFIVCCNKQFLPQRPISRIFVREWI